MKLFNAIAAAAVIGGSIITSASAAEAQTIKHKFKESGDGWRGRPWMGVVVMQNGNTFTPRRTEQTSAFSAVVGSWADYPATAIRACKGDADAFESNDCITTKGRSITLPEGENKIDYTFEFKYRYGDTSRTGNFTF